jgi:hypothetical protein
VLACHAGAAVLVLVLVLVLESQNPLQASPAPGCAGEVASGEY